MKTFPNRFVASMVALVFISPSAQPATSSAGPMLMVVNQKLNAVQIVDPGSGTVTATIATKGIRGHETVVSADGKRAYVPIYGDSGVGKPGTDGRTIEILDLTTNRFIDQIDLGRPARPHCVRLGPDGLLYVTAEVGETLEVVDPVKKRVVRSIPTGQKESHMLVVTRDGSRGYTSNVGAGSVSALDLKNGKTIAVVPVAKVTQRISISVDDKLVFTADQENPRLAAIDTTTNKVQQWIDLPSIGYGTAATPDGKWLLVSLIKDSKIAVVDLAAMKVVRILEVAAGPMEILLRPDRPVAYVSCFAAGKVAIIDLNSWKVSGWIKTGEGADGLAWIASEAPAH